MHADRRDQTPYADANASISNARLWFNTSEGSRNGALYPEAFHAASGEFETTDSRWRLAPEGMRRSDRRAGHLVGHLARPLR